MPLKPGSSKEIVRENIKELIESGYRQDEAVTIALNNAGITKKNIKKSVLKERNNSLFSKDFSLEMDDYFLNAFIFGWIHWIHTNLSGEIARYQGNFTEISLNLIFGIPNVSSGILNKSNNSKKNE